MQNICVVFDIGKTNKKILGFDESFEKVYEKQVHFDEVLDEDGFAGEDLAALSQWVIQEFNHIKEDPLFNIKAVNFSAYGASWVHLDANNKPVSPLYNYLKPFPKKLKKEFEEKYNKDGLFFVKTASPDLGMLNSGLQLYWLKHEKPALFEQIKSSLHLPQYLSFLLTGKLAAEKTSIGCHTAIWDFEKNDYHEWLKAEEISSVPLNTVNTNEATLIDGIAYGTGIHDSSAALVPYLMANTEPFVLLSTGTWSISMNPFNASELTKTQLNNDCLNYISYEGKTVRASRLFAGNEHERQTKHLAAYFNKTEDYYKTVKFDGQIIMKLRQKHKQVLPQDVAIGEMIDCPFVERNLNAFYSYEEAYHQFISDLVVQQLAAIKLTFGNDVPKKIFIDGGFAKNEIFMCLLNAVCFDKQVMASSLAQASSLGAALVIKEHWTNQAFSKANLPFKQF